MQCDGPNVTAIDLRGAGLRGELSQTLGDLTAVTELDLSGNRIGGALPRSLPPALARLDVSSNSLGGELPDSMAKLSSLSTLHLQNNQLTGTLDVLQDLPLTDLDVENNQFSGLIPDKLLSVPKFLRDGNHFTIPTPAAPPSRVAGTTSGTRRASSPFWLAPTYIRDSSCYTGRRPAERTQGQGVPGDGRRVQRPRRRFAGRRRRRGPPVHGVEAAQGEGKGSSCRLPERS